MQEFARWIVGRVNANEQPMVDAVIKALGRHTWEPWSIIAQNHAGEYARATHGEVQMKRQAHYRVAGETIAEMLNQQVDKKRPHKAGSCSHSGTFCWYCDPEVETLANPGRF